MNSQLVVEFLGPAGSGKSTLLKEVGESLRLRGVGVVTVADLKRPSISFLQVSPWRSVLELARVSVSMPATDLVSAFAGRGAIWKLYFFLTRAKNVLAQKRLIQSFPHSLVLVEHGEHFRRSDFELHGVDAGRLAFHKTDVVIYLTISDAEMVNRLISRGLQKGPESKSLAEIPAYRTKYRSAIRGSFENARLTTTCFTFDTSQPVSLLVGQISDVLWDFVSVKQWLESRRE